MAKRACELGAGEILLTSMDADGTRDGFDLDLLNAVIAVAPVPVIASGAVGSWSIFSEVFEKTRCRRSSGGFLVPLSGTDGRRRESAS